MKFKKISIMILILFFVVMVNSNYVIAGGVGFTNSDYLAAITKPLLDQSLDLLRIRDFTALQKLMDAGFVIMLRDGVKVQIMERDWGGCIRIRPIGSTVSVWTLVEAVKIEGKQ